MSFILNRTTAPHTVRFFWVCFRQGVLDACEYGNDIEAKEFCEEHKQDWTFGTLTKPDLDWQMYRHQLYWWARQAGQKSLAEGYLFRIRTKNYSWAVLPYCMRFYLMGISEWLKYPNPGAIEVFKSKPMVHWDPSEPATKVTKMDIISYLHDFEYEYLHAADECKAISEASMSSFISALYDLSRKYVTGSAEEEDV